MPKHATPKKKTGKSTTRQRYGSFKTKVLKKLINRTKLVDCPDCGEKTKAHMVCASCGKYRGRQVVNMDKKISKITKIKA